MTPAERAQKIADAEAMLSQVAADEVATGTVAVPSDAAPLPSFLQKAKSAVASVAAASTPKVPSPPSPKTVVAAATGPGGDTRQSGVASVADTMRTVWAKMRGIKN